MIIGQHRVYNVWYRWFAWRPVRIDSRLNTTDCFGPWVWLKPVWRLRDRDHTTHYRLQEKPK